MAFFSAYGKSIFINKTHHHIQKEIAVSFDCPFVFVNNTAPT